MPKGVKKVIEFFVILVMTAIVLYFSLKDNYQEIMHQIMTINKFWLFVAFALVICYWFFKAMVLKTSVSNFNKDYSLKKAFRLIVETNFFHAITPFASGGQPYEIYSLKRDKLRFSEATNVSIQNFIVYQIALVILGITAIICNYYLAIFPDSSFLKYLVTIGFICNFLVIVGLFILTFAKKINKFLLRSIIFILSKLRIVKDKEKTIDKFQKYLNDFHQGATILMKDKKTFMFMILCNFVALFCLYLIPMVLLFGTGDYTSMNGFESIITSAYVMLIGSFVPIPGGTGGLEYGFIVFYSTFIKGSVLNAIMLMWRFITYYFGMILGAIVLNFKRKKD